MGEMNLLGSTEDYRHQVDHGFDPKEGDFQLKNINVNPLNMTHDQIHNQENNKPRIAEEDESEYNGTGRNGLKDLNLTNFTILSSKDPREMGINESNDDPDGKHQAPIRTHKTNGDSKNSFTNLQAYF